MAESYFPFDAGAGANVSEASWRQMARRMVPSGVFLDSANSLQDLQVYGDSSGRQVKVRIGEAWVDGHFYASTAEQTIPLTTNTSGNPRIDRIVLRVNRTLNTIVVDKLVGTPAATPSAPALTQNATIWEISLAQVAIANGYSTVTAANVTDERPIAAGIDGGSGSLVKLADTGVLTGSTAPPDWQNIPQTFRELQIVSDARSTLASTLGVMAFRFNNDSLGSYFAQVADFGSTTSNPVRTSSVTYAQIADIPAASAPTELTGASVTRLPGYSNGAGYIKKWLSHGVYDSGGATQKESIWGGEWALSGIPNITRIAAYLTGNNLGAGSRLTLYGLR